MPTPAFAPVGSIGFKAAGEEELKHLLIPSPATIAQFIQNAFICIQSHEEDLLDLVPLNDEVGFQIVDVGQVKLKIKVFVVT